MSGVTRDQANLAIQDDVRQEDMAKDEALRIAEMWGVEIAGRRSFFWLRQKWSFAIVGWLTLLILFNCLLGIGVGLSWFNFEKYQWFITAVTVETFLQVIGLGFVAVKFLFSDTARPMSTSDSSREA